MANICYNRMTITGDLKTLKTIKHIATPKYYKDIIILQGSDVLEELRLCLQNHRDEWENYKVIKESQNLIVLEVTKANPRKLFIWKELIGDVSLSSLINGNWYAQRVDKYGSKWLPSPQETYCHLDTIDNSLTLEFSTPWSPLLGASEILTQNFPVDIEHYFSEEGLGIKGEENYSCEDWI